MNDDADRVAETRRAVRLVALCALIAFVLYGLLGLVTTDDNYLVRLGRYKEVEFIAEDVRQFDRGPYGDRPIVWILGSSITRDAFNAEQVERRLHAAGAEHAVVKFAYNRGAPLFSRAVARKLPIRDGDLMVTSIAYDNFRRDWLNRSDFTKYGQTLLSPEELLAEKELAFATRLEWSLAAAPPSHFHQNRDELGWGLLKGLANLTGWQSHEPKENVKFQPYTRTSRAAKRDAEVGKTMPDVDMLLEDGQSNYDGLWQFRDDMRALNVPLTAVCIPHHPWYYSDYIEAPAIARFQDHFDAADLDYVRMIPRNEKSFYDYKHPNSPARAAMSDELADLLSERLGLPLPATSSTSRHKATEASVPAVLWRSIGED